MTLDTLYIEARNLAKSNEMQVLYSNAKEIGLQLFENKSDFTPLQIYFLQYLGFYASLNLDVYLGEVDKMVLNHFIYEDAYTIAKERNRKKDTAPKPLMTTTGTETERIEKSRWVFRQPKGKRLI